MNEPAIAVIGDGKMGRVIAQMVQERGWHLTAMLDAEHNQGFYQRAVEHLADGRPLIDEPAVEHAHQLRLGVIDDKMAGHGIVARHVAIAVRGARPPR